MIHHKKGNFFFEAKYLNLSLLTNLYIKIQIKEEHFYPEELGNVDSIQFCAILGEPYFVTASLRSKNTIQLFKLGMPPKNIPILKKIELTKVASFDCSFVQPSRVNHLQSISYLNFRPFYQVNCPNGSQIVLFTLTYDYYQYKFAYDTENSQFYWLAFTSVIDEANKGYVFHRAELVAKKGKSKSLKMYFQKGVESFNRRKGK